MAEWEKVEDRLISGKGVLRLPKAIGTPANRQSGAFRQLLLTIDVSRKPTTEYLNLKYAIPKSFYGYLQFVRDGYILSEVSIDWTKSAYDSVADISGQTLLAVQCSYEGILQTFFNLGNALNLPSISLQNKIEYFQSLQLGWDEIRVSCYADTAVSAVLSRLNYDKCNSTDPDKVKPPPPPPFPNQLSVPPGTPLKVSKPYVGDDTTKPYTIDSFPDTLGTWNLAWKYGAGQGGSCPYLGQTDTFSKRGKESDTFGLVLSTGVGNLPIWRLTQNGISDPITLVEATCLPSFVPPPVFVPDP
jgi:hypothetical protein